MSTVLFFSIVVISPLFFFFFFTSLGFVSFEILGSYGQVLYSIQLSSRDQPCSTFPPASKFCAGSIIAPHHFTSQLSIVNMHSFKTNAMN
jgi:hypothetical protein